MKRFLCVIFICMFLGSCSYSDYTRKTVLDNTNSFFPPTSTNIQPLNNFWFSFDYNGKSWYARIETSRYSDSIVYIEKGTK